MKLGFGVVLVVAVMACAPDWDGLDPSLASGEGGAGGGLGEEGACVGASAGTVADLQTAGDCQVLRCDGLGNTVSSADPKDPPASDECNEGVCEDGEPGLEAKAYGTSCHGNRICDGKGACVKCWWDCKD